MNTQIEQELLATPDPGRILQLSMGYMVSRAVDVIASLGIADLLAYEPKSAHELAAAIGAHGPSLHRVLSTLAAFGLFTELGDGNFALNRYAAPLRRNVPYSVRDFVLYLGCEWQKRTWQELSESVRTGETMFERAMGAPFFEYFAAHPAEAKTFNEAMSFLTRLAVGTLLADCDLSQSRRLVDVGGGDGTLLVAVLRAHPQIAAVLFDRPAVIGAARRNFEADGLTERCEFIGGDFFVGVPPGADTYLLKNVIHDWDDERAVAILGNCRQAMAPQGRVVLIETVLRRGVTQAYEKLIDLAMLVQTGGRERTQAQYCALFERAGLCLARMVAGQSSLSVIEAVAA